MADYTIDRDVLVGIVEDAIEEAERCAPSTREKFIEVAKTTDKFAAGWFHCDGVGCIARQARRPNQGFQTAFDHSMWRFLGVQPGSTVLVEVTASKEQR